jgi:16S rRNA (cytosine967-C5)-methyltransferase
MSVQAKPSKLSDSRRAALRTLIVARERNAYVRELLNSKAGIEGRAGLSERDAAFAERLALGVAATYGTLDEAIDSFVTNPSSLDPEVRDALRISTFELLFLCKQPHVAVSQGVELVKTQAKSAAGLANAVLRRIADASDDFMSESRAHRYGLPEWLCKRIVSDLGMAALDEFGRAGLTQAPAFLASVPMWIPDSSAEAAFAENGVEVRSAGSVPGSWRADDMRQAVRCPLVAQQDVKAIVTDYGAQVVAYLAAPKPGERMLEVGSGRGTKTILMASHAFRAGGASRIWALDVHEGRSNVAENRLKRARVDGVVQVMGDARHLEDVDGLPSEFDRILVDAPCSGTGTLRRHPEITWSLTPSAVDDLARTQAQMLDSCARRLARGGVITYATCSVLCQENEDVVDAFLDSDLGAEFEVVRPEKMARDRACAREFDVHTSPDGYLRTLVREGGSDGHFCICLRRK